MAFNLYSDWSDTAYVDVILLFAPENLLAVQDFSGVGFVDVSWDTSINADVYTLERSTNSSFTPPDTLTVYTGPNNFYDDTVAQEGTYYYRVKAIHNSPNRVSRWSDTASVQIILNVVANFEGEPVSGYKFLTVSFFDLSEGSVLSWYWDFGDGEFSTEQNPVHYYSHAGLYTVSLTITGAAGTDIKTIIDYISVNSIMTYDVAPAPDKIMFLYGVGGASKNKVGVKISVNVSEGPIETGFVRDQGPSLISD